MLDKIEYLEDGEIKYPMAFTVNVMESIEDEYGGLQNWVKSIDREEPSYKAIKFMLLEVMNEGIDIENEKLSISKKREMVTPKQIGRMITRIGFEKIGTTLFKLIQESLPKGEASKNAKTTQNRKA